MLEFAMQLAFVDGIGFDPFFRGLLSVLAITVALIGGTYLIVATNTGGRLGGLLTLAGFFGWMFLMGIVWTIYGIGWAGQAPTWELMEINFDDAADNDDGLLFAEFEKAAELAPGEGGLPASGLGGASFPTDAVLDRIDADGLASAELLLSGADEVAEVEDQDLAQEAALVASRNLDIGDWRYLVTSDAIRGEAQASADAFLVEETEFEPGDYVPRQFGAFLIDGKPPLAEDANMFDRVVHFFDETFLHPAYGQEVIVVQVQGALAEPTLPGQPPPVAAVDDESALVSVIMERNRGGPVPALFSGLRFTPAMFTFICGALFAIFALLLHWRDEQETRIRAAAS